LEEQVGLRDEGVGQAWIDFLDVGRGERAGDRDSIHHVVYPYRFRVWGGMGRGGGGGPGADESIGNWRILALVDEKPFQLFFRCVCVYKYM